MKKTYLKFPGHAPKIIGRRFGVTPFVTAAFKTDGGDGKGDEGSEIKSSADLLKALTETKANLEKGMEGKAKEIVDAQIKSVNDAMEKIKGLPDSIKAEDLVKMQDDLKTTIADFDKWQVKMNAFVRGGGNAPAKTQEQKSFNEILAETIEANVEAIKSFKKGDDRTFRLKGFEDEKVKEVKAVGDMSISANYPGASTYLTDIRQQMIQSPYDRVWLADILPGGTSSQSQSVLYPKENGGEGDVAAWTDSSTDKAKLDLDLTTYAAYFKWLAGHVIIDREMLDDIPFMMAYVQSRMLISYKKSQNNLILNGTSDTNPVVGMLTAATAYNGSFTKGVDKIIDAGWGQIVEDTDEFYVPSHTILRPRAAVGIGLNTADGSGEYDLPAGSVAFVNGKLTVGGITTVTTTNTNLAATDFITFDKNAMMFITRMQPELRMFEDKALALRNKIMFRIEGRGTLATFNNDAIVKGTL